jgi:plastocyanin
VGIRRALLLGGVALLGAATVVLPAMASSEAPPTVEAVTYKYLAEERRYWLPEAAQVGEGGRVTFSNSSSVYKHGLQFTGGPAVPSCTGLPAAAGEAAGATSWQGQCSFTAAGTYTFICTVHPTEMKGTVTVSPAGATTTATNPTTQSTTTTTPTTTAPAQNGPPGAGSLLAGTPSAAVKVPRSQRGGSVKGSVLVGNAGAGGRLVVQLLVGRASLATGAAAREVQVGRLTRSSLRAGRVSFAVSLNARARRALRRRGHLNVKARLRLSVGGGAAVTVTRSVTLRPG